MSQRWTHTACSLFRLASFPQQYAFKLRLCLHGLKAHFCLLLNDIPLHEGTSLFTHSPTKDILVASKFW